MTADHQLEALADPTRRAIFDMVVERPSSVGALARRLPVSQPAVSQHLRVLRRASLVKHTVEGARHVYTPDPDGLGALRDWIDGMWDDVMDSFARAALEEARADGSQRQPQRKGTRR